MHALARVAKFLTFHRKRVLLKAFIESQFSYCPLIWMFCSRKMNRKINYIHERALRLVYDDYESSFDELLSKIIRFLFTTGTSNTWQLRCIKLHTIFVHLLWMNSSLNKKNSREDLVSILENPRFIQSTMATTVSEISGQGYGMKCFLKNTNHVVV